jgi:hypothetical protein
VGAGDRAHALTKVSTWLAREKDHFDFKNLMPCAAPVRTLWIRALGVVIRADRPETV